MLVKRALTEARAKRRQNEEATNAARGRFRCIQIADCDAEFREGRAAKNDANGTADVPGRT